MIDLLRKLGLNKYESEAYVALARQGSASAFEISKISGVPFGRIYDSLNVLVMKGLVEVVPSKPKKYKAVNPESALNGLIDEQFNTLSDLRSKVKEEAGKLIEVKQGKALVSVNSGKVNFSKRVMEHFDYENEFWATSEDFKLEKSYPAINRYLKGEASNRYVLIDKNKANLERLKDVSADGVNFRHYPLSNVRLLVSDEELVTIAFKDSNEWVNIHVNSKSLGKALTKLLKTAWSKAKNI